MLKDIELLKNDLNNNNLLDNILILDNNKNFRFKENIKAYNENKNINGIYLNKLLYAYINTYKVINNILLSNCINLNIDFYNYKMFDFNIYKEINIIHYITTYILSNYFNYFTNINLNKKSFLLINKKDIKNFIGLNKDYHFSYNDIVIKSNDYYLFINPYENFNENSLKYNQINFENCYIDIDFLYKKVDIKII